MRKGAVLIDEGRLHRSLVCVRVSVACDDINRSGSGNYREWESDRAGVGV